ncbi:partial Blue-light-activated histidine kinase 2, partial [Anaerolineae bacterium]
QTATDRIPRDQAVIEAMPIPCWETDPSGSRLNVNAAWRQLTGHSENHTIDGWTAGILETDRQHLQSEFTSARQNNAPIDIECRIVAHDGTLRLARMQGLPLPGSENAFASYRGVLVDVTAAHARQADAIARMHEKDVLIKEIHHRVKNNMQIISSVLSLQESAVKDPFDLMLFRESQCRIRTMGLVHEHLYHTKNFAAVDFGAYIRNLADALRAAYAPAEDRCALQVEADDVTLDINSAIPAGLLVHEGLSNAFRHAFPGDRAGLVTVRFSQQPDGIRRLSVADNGVGLPPGLDVVATDSLGFRLMHMLADQLDGNLALVSGDGLTLTLTFGG